MEASRTPRMTIPTQLVLQALLADPSKEALLLHPWVL
jgi:hypothetical protein